MTFLYGMIVRKNGLLNGNNYDCVYHHVRGLIWEKPIYVMWVEQLTIYFKMINVTAFCSRIDFKHRFYFFATYINLSDVVCSYSLYISNNMHSCFLLYCTYHDTWIQIVYGYKYVFDANKNNVQCNQ